jgi:hypothetical protein
MALVLADRVKETTTTTGTGTVTLLGASTGFQSFAAVGNANTTYYTIAAQTGTEWEVGIGTYTSSSTTLARNTVLSSSNSGSPVNFSAGTKDVFVTYPSSRSIYADGTVLTATNSSILPVANGGTGLTAGTSGGVLAFTATGTLASSAALAASALVIGGGAGAAPSTTATGTGVVTALGVNTGTAGAFVVNGGALGSPSSVGTMPAFTLGGTIAGGGNQINNVIIGTTTPLAGAFTSLTASTTLGVTGVSTLTAGAVVQGLTVGLGAGAVSTNTAVGVSALAANTSGAGNVAIGDRALNANTTGSSNVGIGQLSLFISTGEFNTAIGAASLRFNTASNNTAVGYQAGYTNQTSSLFNAIGYQAGYSYNHGTADVASLFCGSRAGYSQTSGLYNTYVGEAAGYDMTLGAKNTILGRYTGNQGGLDIRTASNYVVLSDGDGNPRAYWNGANATFNGALALTGTLSGGTSGTAYSFSGSAPATSLTLDSSGNLGVGTSSPSYKIDATGSTTSGSGIVTTLRLKNSGVLGSDGAKILFTAGTSTDGAGIGSGGVALDSADLRFFTGGNTERMRLDTSGRLGIGTATPDTTTLMTVAGAITITGNNTGHGASRLKLGQDTSAISQIRFYGVDAATAGILQFTGNSSDASVGGERMRLDSSGNLMVGTTAAVTGAKLSSIASGGDQAAAFRSDASTSVAVLNLWGNEASGNQIFTRFATDSNAERGSITYNRAGGLVAYNVTSDYRAKDIYGPVTGSGALIDSTPVYMGKMKDATQERPMFIAHEVPAYAHTGVKDAVDKDGKPVYQQMDASALIPVMWAELQSLRARVAQLESKA